MRSATADATGDDARLGEVVASRFENRQHHAPSRRLDTRKQAFDARSPERQEAGSLRHYAWRDADDHPRLVHVY